MQHSHDAILIEPQALLMWKYHPTCAWVYVGVNNTVAD